MRLFKKTFLLLVIIGVLFGSASYLFIQVYGDQIKKELITYLNQYLNTEVQTAGIEVSMWEKFPKVSVNFSDIELKESLPGSKENLAVFERVYFMLDLWEILQGNYVVEKILLENGRINPVIQEDYSRNFRIFKESQEQAKQETQGNFSLNLKNITLKNVGLQYRNKPHKEEFKAYFEKVTFRGKFNNDLYIMHANAKSLVDAFKIGDQKYIQNKPVSLQCKLRVNKDSGIYDIQRGNLRIAEADFQLTGAIHQQKKGPELDLNIKGAKNKLQTLLAIVPEQFRKSFKSFNGKGKFYFNADLTGIVTPKTNPRLDIKFGIEDGTILKEGVRHNLKNVNLEGTFTNGHRRDMVSTLLEIKHFKAELNNRTISGSLTLNNFTDPYLNLSLETNVRLADAEKYIPLENIAKMKGNLFLDAAFAGRIRDLKSVETVHKANFTGKMSLREVYFQTVNQKLNYHDLNGNFRFNGNDLLVNDFNGYVGESNFHLNGHFRNLASFMFLPNEKLTIDANFRSKKINLKPLLTTEYNKQSQDSVVTFALPDYLVLNLAFQCDQVNYERFHAASVSGDIKYQEETLHLNDLSYQAMNGKFNLSGSFASTKNGNLKAKLNAKGQNIAISKLFYQMDNFGQKVLTNEHLQGTVNTNIDLEATWDENLNPKLDELYVNSQVSISNGELNNFSPIMKLAGLIEVRELKHLSFQKLANNVIIKNQKIHIPKMEIQSNAFKMDFSGVHTFNNIVNYHMRINLSELLFGKKEDYETAFGKVVHKDNGQMNLFVKMTGKASDPKIQYDRKAVVDKIKQDLKKEGKELEQVFDNKDSNQEDKEEYELKWDE